jgi:hypothetical protein
MRFLSKLRSTARGVLSSLVNRGKSILQPLKNLPKRSQVNDLNEDEKIALKIAIQSYEQNPTRFIQSNNGMFELNLQQTTPYFKPYVNADRKTIFLGVRGTDKDIKDLAEDAVIIAQDLGVRDIQFKQLSVRLSMLKEKISTLRRIYSGYSIVLVGHSLGGRLSKEVSRGDPSIRSITFNSGGLDLQENIKDAERTNIQDITTGTDLVSIGSIFNPRTKVYNPRGLGVGIGTHKLSAWE